MTEYKNSGIDKIIWLFRSFVFVHQNEKYAFRCFLLRLGFIGDEFKADRKILLSKLDGSAAFKSGAKKGGEQ